MAGNGGRQIFFPTQAKPENWKMKTEQPTKIAKNNNAKNIGKNLHKINYSFSKFALRLILGALEKFFRVLTSSHLDLFQRHN